MKYRKKPVVIEAIQWTGKNNQEIFEFCDGKAHFRRDQEVSWVDIRLKIETLEGDMKASENDFIIKGISGEFYPCKPDIFEQTYELVEV